MTHNVMLALAVDILFLNLRASLLYKPSLHYDRKIMLGLLVKFETSVLIFSFGFAL